MGTYMEMLADRAGQAATEAARLGTADKNRDFSRRRTS